MPSPAVWLMSKHSMRSGDFRRSSKAAPASASISSMSARRARRMRNACVAFSTVIAIQRAGNARDGRHTRVSRARAFAERLHQRLGFFELEIHQDFRAAAACSRSTA